MAVRSPGYGRKGDKGDASSTPGPSGASAYQVALAAGFSGTEAQWLASLKGGKGDTGPSGSAFVGNLNVTETLLVSLALGMKRKTFGLAGVSASDKLIFAPTAAPTLGCEVINVYPAGANQISVGYYTPALGIAATYSMPIAVYRLP